MKRTQMTTVLFLLLLISMIQVSPGEDWFGDPDTTFTLKFEESEGFIAGMPVAGIDYFVSNFSGNVAITTNTTSYSGEQCLYCPTTDTLGWRGLCYDLALFETPEYLFGCFSLAFRIKGRWICRIFDSTGTKWSVDIVADGSFGEDCYYYWREDHYGHHIHPMPYLKPGEWVFVRMSLDFGDSPEDREWAIEIDSESGEFISGYGGPYHDPDSDASKYLVISPYQSGDTCYIDDLHFNSPIPTSGVKEWYLY